MYLKSLTMRGFKSFADKTTLELEPGVTAVVGPNGSGKSNVVDAVAWVLGAQGARALRGSKMDDVIFAGTATRPALGRAEVQLQIDNSDGRLPIEFSEVTIARTLFRSGESEYALNGTPCRLLDIQELLSDSGIGRQQHVIVGQGQLDSVLSSQPTDRRMIIEEAAGILKFRRRKEKAERRLESTEGNVIRLTDMVREVRRSLTPLGRQAESARRSGDLAAELRSIKIFLLGQELKGLQSRLTRIADERQRANDRDAELKRQLGRYDAELILAENELGGNELDGINELRRLVEAARERRRGLAGVLAERQRSLERELEAIADEDVYESLVADALSVRTALAAVDAEEGEVEAAHSALEDARRAVVEAEAAATQAREVDELARAAAEERQRVEHTLTGSRTLFDRVTAEHARSQTRVEELEQLADTHAGTAAALTSELTLAQSNQPQLDEAAEAAHIRRQEAEQARLQAEHARVEAERARAHWLARAEALTAALDVTRTESAVQALQGQSGVDGLVADLVEIDPGAEAAVTAALGEVLRAVAVRTGQMDAAVLDVLAAPDMHALLLATDHAGTAQQPLLPPTLTPLTEVVRARDPHISQTLQRLLSHTALFRGSLSDAMELARTHQDLTIVTERGDRIGGAVWHIGVEQPGVTRAACEEALAAADTASNEVESAIQVAKEAADAVERARLEEESTAAARRSGEANIGALQRDAERMTSERARLQQELDRAMAALASLASDAATAEREVAALTEQFAAAAPSQDVQETARLRSIATTNAERCKEQLATSELEFGRQRAAIAERRTGLQTRLSEIDGRLARHPGQQSQVSARREQVAEAIRSAALQQERLEQARSDLELMWENVMRRAQAADARRSGARAALDALRARRTAAEEELAIARAQLAKLDVETAETNVRLEQATLTAREQYDIETDIARAAEPPELGEGVSFTARARELERELRILGPVNPLAVEEYEAASERHSFLSQQLEDVKDARKELHRIIRTVDQEIVSNFEAAFTDVAKHFEDLFTTLFPGGSGSLSLTDPNDLLHTGIEIEARPSGKNVRRLTLLSGGERSLTAMAYLFAVFRSRPSPFYLLDEVEAALDDVNLQRFLDLVAAFRGEAQLLIVTHQKRTMDTADCIYGVSMPPGGSTKVVSQRINEADQ